MNYVTIREDIPKNPDSCLTTRVQERIRAYTIHGTSDKGTD
jgi:hypothetical protein